MAVRRRRGRHVRGRLRAPPARLAPGETAQPGARRGLHPVSDPAAPARAADLADGAVRHRGVLPGHRVVPPVLRSPGPARRGPDTDPQPAQAARRHPEHRPGGAAHPGRSPGVPHQPRRGEDAPPRPAGRRRPGHHLGDRRGRLRPRGHRHDARARRAVRALAPAVAARIPLPRGPRPGTGLHRRVAARVQAADRALLLRLPHLGLPGQYVAGDHGAAPHPPPGDPQGALHRPAARPRLGPRAVRAERDTPDEHGPVHGPGGAVPRERGQEHPPAEGPVRPARVRRPRRQRQARLREPLQQGVRRGVDRRPCGPRPLRPRRRGRARRGHRRGRPPAVGVDPPRHRHARRSGAHGAVRADVGGLDRRPGQHVADPGRGEHRQEAGRGESRGAGAVQAAPVHRHPQPQGEGRARARPGAAGAGERRAGRLPGVGRADRRGRGHAGGRRRGAAPGLRPPGGTGAGRQGGRRRGRGVARRCRGPGPRRGGRRSAHAVERGLLDVAGVVGAPGGHRFPAASVRLLQPQRHDGLGHIERGVRLHRQRQAVRDRRHGRSGHRGVQAAELDGPRGVHPHPGRRAAPGAAGGAARGGPDALADDRTRLKRYLLGPDEPPSIERFDKAVTRLTAKADERLARLASSGAGDGEAAGPGGAVPQQRDPLPDTSLSSAG